MPRVIHVDTSPEGLQAIRQLAAIAIEAEQLEYDDALIVFKKLLKLDLPTLIAIEEQTRDVMNANGIQV